MREVHQNELLPLYAKLESATLAEKNQAVEKIKNFNDSYNLQVRGIVGAETETDSAPFLSNPLAGGGFLRGAT